MTPPVIPGRDVVDPELRPSTPSAPSAPVSPKTGGGPPVGAAPPSTNPDDRFNGIAGKPEVWKDSDTGQMYVVYEVPGVEPPIPLLFEVYGGMETLKGFFGDKPVSFDRTLTSSEVNSVGAVRFGTTNNLVASEGDPWLGFVDRMERLSKTTPWVNDDEILTLLGGAYLEDRKLEDWEIDNTQWSLTHNTRERDYMKLQLSDPQQALVQAADDGLYLSSLFDKVGATDNDPALLSWMANRFTTGAWSQATLVSQVEAVTSGWGDVDGELQAYIDSNNFEVSTTQAKHNNVRTLWEKWLGPAYRPTEAQVAEWATKMRNTSDGEDELISMLQGQRLAMYPGYENPNLSYQDIAGPWRELASSMWGQDIDETSDMFQEIIRYNDYGEASRRLRTEGLNQNIEKVWSDATKQFRSDQSTNVRRAV